MSDILSHAREAFAVSVIIISISVTHNRFYPSLSVIAAVSREYHYFRSQFVDIVKNYREMCAKAECEYLSTTNEYYK